MKIIKLDAINSTNDYLKELLKNKSIKKNYIVYSYNQTNGKGQRGNVWYSEPDKNLAFSLFLLSPTVNLKNQFIINIIISLFIIDFLDYFKIPNLSIKWPNDIMSGNKKICGILNEIQLKKKHIESIIIGFGININQENFNNLPNASSLKLITKKNYDLNNFTKILIKKLKKNNFFVPFFTDTETLNQENLISSYNNKLYCRKKLKSFKLSNGKIFHGNIESVDSNGILNVKEKNHSLLRSFNDKEIQIII
tara:strand:- start:556 stop:1308 length:753 start_codon:yes stop_codon:yes gene_type:complete